MVRIKAFLPSLIFITSIIFFSTSCMQNKANNGDPAARLLIDAKALLGEGAIWNYKTNELYWIDIEKGILYIYDPVSRQTMQYPFNKKIGTVVPTNDGNALVALQDGIYELNITTGKVEFLDNPLENKSDIRFNDGKCDPAGRFWVGTMALDAHRFGAALYRYGTDGILKKMLDSITISNGIVWTSDHKTMYYIDTPTQQVKRFQYDESTGDIVPDGIAVTIPKDLGSPDGMTIDEDDMLWVAHWGGYGVYRWNPKTGKLLEKIAVPAKNVTSCAFGGEKLDNLYITTARNGNTPEELQKYPASGGLFMVKPGVKGVKASFYGKSNKDSSPPE